MKSLAYAWAYVKWNMHLPHEIRVKERDGMKLGHQPTFPKLFLHEVFSAK